LACTVVTAERPRIVASLAIVMKGDMALEITSLVNYSTESRFIEEL
jgi:hypothetical protein